MVQVVEQIRVQKRNKSWNKTVTKREQFAEQAVEQEKKAKVTVLWYLMEQLWYKK